MKATVMFALSWIVVVAAAASEAPPPLSRDKLAAALAPLPDWNDGARALAESYLRDTFTFQGVTATVPRLPGGGLDWNYRGPNNDPEFAWFLNRHQQLPAWFVAWRATGDERYRRALNEAWRDWLENNPKPRLYSLSASWRALEAARRVGDTWLPVLLAPGADAALDPATRAAVLASLPAHAVCLRDTHAPSGNHLLTEMAALAALALALPEFEESPSWLAYAVRTTRAELARQFYPDGAHTELANHYQLVALRALQRFADLLRAAGCEPDFPELRPALESAWTYFAYTTKPSGDGPLNNDSSREDNAAAVRAVATLYDRPDWLAAAAGRAESRYFPWSGQAVLRGGAGADATWVLFDAGPYGSAHQHADRLHLNVSAGGRDFLVDNGRYTYQPGPWRDYFAGPRAHNVILLDGRGTLRPPDTVKTPPAVRFERGPGWDFVSATAPFAGDARRGQGPAYHTRAILRVKENMLFIADRIIAAGPHRVEALWHFAPDCAVQRAGDLLYTNEPNKQNIRLRALNPPPGGWDIELVRGREGAQPQGWHSPEYNEKLPATCAVFSVALHGPHTLLWMLEITPAGAPEPGPQRVEWVGTSDYGFVFAYFHADKVDFAHLPLSPDMRPHAAAQ